MAVQDLDNIPIYEEIAFFEPLVRWTSELILRLERKNNKKEKIKDELQYFYALQKGKPMLIQDIYLLRDEWGPWRHYFMSKTPIYYFYEPQMRGLVNKDGRFWIFPSFEQLRQLCYREQITVNQLTPELAKKIPFQALAYYFHNQLRKLLSDEERVYSIRTQECEKYLKLANFYLSPTQTHEVHLVARILLKVGLRREIFELIQLLEGKVLVDTSKINKRMRAVHSVSMKYYFARAEREQKQKLDSLIGRNKGSRLHALKYLLHVVERSFLV